MKYVYYKKNFALILSEIARTIHFKKVFERNFHKRAGIGFSRLIYINGINGSVKIVVIEVHLSNGEHFLC